jgi:uncharacterized iron-regulated protein
MRVLVALLLGAQAAQPAPLPTYVPQRVYETGRQAFSDFEAMLADLAKADVVLVGEQHDDPNTHRLEAAILEGLANRSADATVSLEMFERDVQPALDSYLAGRSTPEEFLRSSRPWPRYATDYGPLVEFAKSRGWPVVASNVPRRHASAAAKAGRVAHENVAAEERAFIAQDLQCPRDTYFERFAETMVKHPVPGSEKLTPDERGAATERYYFAQCMKDETMAEAIVAALERRGRGPVVHFNGAFHSDFGLGTAERVRRRLAGRRVAVVSILPVGQKELEAALPSAEDLRRAEFLVYTTK